jgi:hypothetical protein
MPEMKDAINPRIIAVGSVTGNDNTVGRGGVYPVADLRELEELKQVLKEVRKLKIGHLVEMNKLTV